jgi:hypothetical protein
MRTVLAVFLVALCCACTSANSTPPAPTRTMTGSPVRPSSPTVSPQWPGGVSARWVPNLNWKHAQPVVTHGSAVLARELRYDIATARVFPRGEFSCPIDVGVAARLTLHLANIVEHAVATLTGCATVTVPGHRACFVTKALRHDLATIAPKRWRQYLDS